MAEVFAIGFIENLKVLFVGILIYAIIFAMLKQIKILGEDPKVNSLVALIAAIIVSFSGVVTYAVSYAINWFIIILFLVFLLMVLLLFLGVDMKAITGQVTKNSKPILIAFVILFSIIFFKSFFAVNNSFDLNDPQNDSYDVDASFNTGVDDITNKEINEGFFDKLFSIIDKELFSAVLFLVAIGIFIIIIG